jgi:putative acetyltransferase
MKGLGIRPYRPDDRISLQEAINSICAEGIMATASFQPTPAWEHALARPECPHHLLLVAEAAGEIVGWCRLFPEGLCDSPAVLELGIGVTSPWRGQGIGNALIRHALEWAAEKGVSRIVLTTRTDNEPARCLFARYGFYPTRTQDHWLEMAWNAPSGRSGA